MGNKLLALLLGILATTSLAGPRVGYYDSMRLRDDTSYVELKAPAGVSTWSMTMPVDDGAADQALVTDGSGVTAWAGPFMLDSAGPFIPVADGPFVAPGDVIETGDNDTESFWAYPALGTQAYTYSVLKGTPSFTSLAGGYYFLGHYANGTTVRDDYSVLDSGSNITTVGRNVALINLHDNINTVGDYYTSIADNTQIQTVTAGSVTGINLNFKANSVPSDITGINVTPQGTQRGLTAQVQTVQATADVAGNLGGKYMRICTVYSENPNVCYKAWYDVDNGSTPPSADGDTLVEIDISEDDSAAAVGDATQPILHALARITATDDNAGLITVTMDNQGKAGGIDAGNLGWTTDITVGGGGDGRAVGLQIGMYNVSGYTDENTVAIDTSGGRASVGQLSAYKQYTIAASPGNPTTVHVLSSDLILGDNQTITDGDSLGVGGIGTLTVGTNSTVTSGGLRVGSTSDGKIVLVNIGAGSSVQDARGTLAATVLTGGTGVLENGEGFRAVAIDFGGSTPITNYRAFYADAPGGTPATNFWGLYARPEYQNYMGGGIKIGGAVDTDDKLSSANAGLEITEYHIRSTGTAPTATVDSNAGTGGACSVSNATDVAGTIELTADSAAASSGTQCAIDFVLSYDTAPICTVTPRNAAAGMAPTLVGPYFAATTTALEVNFANAELVGETYQWDYHCIETE